MIRVAAASTGVAILFVTSQAAAEWVNPANGHTYGLTPEPLSWTEAQAHAIAEGGHLVSVNDAAEQAWLVATISVSGEFFFWLGGRDQQVPAWIWTTGEPFSYTNWRSNEPDGDIAVGESYLAMFADSPLLGLWVDLYNESDGRHYGIVEIVPSVPTLAVLVAFGALRRRAR